MSKDGVKECGGRRERRDQTAAGGGEADQQSRSRDSSEVFVIRQLREPGEDNQTGSHHTTSE